MRCPRIMTTSTLPDLISLYITSKTEIADGIYLFELRGKPADTDEPPSPLPAFTAGAHLLVDTPSGIARRYSLCNSRGERDGYVIAVKLDAAGGGSASMVNDVQVGMRLTVSSPQNYFPLNEQASSHLLIAGGIGITPVRAMIAQLAARNADFKVVYCTRSPETTAFLEELSATDLAPRVMVHHDFGDREQSIDLVPLL